MCKKVRGRKHGSGKSSVFDVRIHVRHVQVHVGGVIDQNEVLDSRIEFYKNVCLKPGEFSKRVKT